MIVRTYSELRQLHSFEDRFDYLRLSGTVGTSTFGFDRHINQKLYQSSAWKSVRREVTIRDNGCDLGIEGYEIHGALLVHHMNPIGVADILERQDWVLDPEFLITTTNNTHNAIHYGNDSLLPKPVVARAPGDTRLW